MKNKSKIDFNIRTSLGVRLTPIISIAIIVSCGLFTLDFALLKKQCNDKSHSPNVKEFYCTSSILVGNLANDVVLALISMIGFNRFLHKKTIEEVEKIFRATQCNQYVSYINLDIDRDKEYQKKVLSLIDNLSNHSKIKIICLSETISCLNTISSELYVRKIKAGCDFKILTMHPDSKVLSCMIDFNQDKSGNKIERYRNEIEDFSEKVKKIDSNQESKANKENGKKTIQLKYIKKDYSSYSLFLCEDNGVKSVLLWMRSIANEDDYCYPLFEFSDKASIEQLEKQFDILWNRASTSSKSSEPHKPGKSLVTIE